MALNQRTLGGAQALLMTIGVLLVLGKTFVPLTGAWYLNWSAIRMMETLQAIGGDPLLRAHHLDKRRPELVEGLDAPPIDQASFPDLSRQENLSTTMAALDRAWQVFPLRLEIHWYLARALYLQGDYSGALESLVIYGESHPEDLGVPPALGHLYDHLSVRFDDIHADWTEVPYTVIEPHESRQVQLRLPSLRPRVVRLGYHDSPGRELVVSVTSATLSTGEGVMQGQISGQGRGWQTYEVAVPPFAGDMVSVTLTNPTENQQVAIHQLSLQYLPGTRFFDDMAPDWSEKPFKPLGPGERYEGRLFLPAVRPRLFKLEYYEHPAQDLTVALEGAIVGKARWPIGGWSELTWPVPATAGDIVHVSLMNMGTESGALIRRIQLVYR